MSVSYQPWYVNCTDPKWDIPLNNDNNNEDITLWDITTFTMTFRNTVGTDVSGTGAFSKKVNAPPEVYYQPSDADVASTFQGQLFVKAINPVSGKRVVWDPISFVISPS